MNTLFLDLETFSTVPITHGTHRYAEAAEVLLIPHAWNDEPAVTWDATEEGCDPRAMLISLIEQADEVVIHNSHFDRTVMRWQGVDLPIEKVHDTMVRAMMHSLPGALGQLCDILGVATDKAKDKDGKRLIHLFTKPLGKNRKLDRATKETHPLDWEKFKDYARLDVEAMREVYKLLPRWNYTQSEVELWRLDQKINDRGVAIDLDLAHAALRAAKRAGESLAARAKALTDGAVPSATQRNVLMSHLETIHGFAPPDLKKGTVASLLKDGDLPDGVAELLEVRQQAAATSPAKYKVLINATSSDARLRGILQFCGAVRTGRWCLAEGTQVTVCTDGVVGEKPIEQVSVADLVWDGEFWVPHEGVVFSGDKEVISCGTLIATAEHVVYVGPDSAMPFGRAVNQGAQLWTGKPISYTA